MREVLVNGWRRLSVRLIALLVLAPSVAGVLAGSSAVSQAAVVLTGDGTTHTISASAGEGGSISPDGAVSVIDGDNQTFTITADTGYSIADVFVDGVSVGAVGSYTFTNVTTDFTISASFAIDSYTLTYTAGADGTISGTTPQTVNHDADGTLVTAVPNTGYHFVSWSDGYPTAARTDLNVIASKSVTASFAIDTFTITPSAGLNGTITPSVVQTVDYGSGPTFTITPAANYHVLDVLVNGVSVGPVTSYTFINVTANQTISVSFAINTFAITPTTGLHGTITPAVVQTVDYGATPAFTFTPDTGYHIADVLVDGSSVGTGTSYTFPAVAANHTISVSFAINTYTITPTAGPHGAISPAVVQTVDYGASPTFTITPATGYHVADVLVDGLTVEAVTSYTFTTVTAAHTISVTFAINTYTIAPSAAANGAISPANPQTVEYGANQAFAITPAIDHYVADVLVDGVSVGPVASYTFTNVTAAHTISASFAVGVQTRLSIGVGQTIVDHGGSTLLTGVLYDSHDPLHEVGMGDRLVTLQSAPSTTGPWVDLKAQATSSVAGSVGKCTSTVTPTSSTYYRLRFVAGAGSGYGGTLSFMVRVGVRPVLGTPKVPSSVRAGRSFTVSGTLSPQLPAGQKTVVINVHRLKNGHWVFIKGVSATNANSGDGTRYSVSVKFTTKGKYRFRAHTAPTTTWASDTTGLSTVLTVK